MSTITLPSGNPLTAQIDLGGIWHVSTFFGCAIFALGFVFQRRHRLGLPERLLWVYVLIYSLFILEYPMPHFGAYTTAFQATAGQVFAEALLIPLGIMWIRNVKWTIPWTSLFSLASVQFGWDGLLIAPSLNSAFAACALPLVPFWIQALTVLVIITHHGTTALLILAAQIFALMIRDRRWTRKLVLAIPVLAVVAYYHSGAFFDGAERLHNYSRFMHLWARRWNWIVFGVGPGSFMWTSLMLDDFKGNLFLQMHSDWLQILWELGILGFGLSVAVFVNAARRAWNHPRELAALFGLVAFGLTYYPTRFYPSACLAAFIIFNYNKQLNPARRY